MIVINLTILLYLIIRFATPNRIYSSSAASSQANQSLFTTHAPTPHNRNASLTKRASYLSKGRFQSTSSAIQAIFSSNPTGAGAGYEYLNTLNTNSSNNDSIRANKAMNSMSSETRKLLHDNLISKHSRNRNLSSIPKGLDIGMEREKTGTAFPFRSKDKDVFRISTYGFRGSPRMSVPQTDQLDFFNDIITRTPLPPPSVPVLSLTKSSSSTLKFRLESEQSASSSLSSFSSPSSSISLQRSLLGPIFKHVQPHPNYPNRMQRHQLSYTTKTIASAAPKYKTRLKISTQTASFSDTRLPPFFLSPPSLSLYREEIYQDPSEDHDNDDDEYMEDDNEDEDSEREEGEENTEVEEAETKTESTFALYRNPSNENMSRNKGKIKHISSPSVPLYIRINMEKYKGKIEFDNGEFKNMFNQLQSTDKPSEPSTLNQVRYTDKKPLSSSYSTIHSQNLHRRERYGDMEGDNVSDVDDASHLSLLQTNLSPPSDDRSPFKTKNREARVLSYEGKSALYEMKLSSMRRSRGY